jgi:uncharacterized membrane-anchored protein YjiN (DUF445 family)
MIRIIDVVDAPDKTIDNRCGRCPAKFVGKLIGITNCNKDHPENHNIVYTNKSGSVAWVKHDDKMGNVDEAINKWYEGILDETNLEDTYDLPREMKVKLEDLYENDEMNRKANSMAKDELYNGYKSGAIKKVDDDASPATLTET